MADPIAVPLWVPIATAAAGGFTVGIFNLFTNWQNKRFEERKHFRELLMNVAVEQWKQESTRFIESMKLNKSATLLPLDSHLIHLMKLSEVLLDSKITKETIADKLRQVHEVANEVAIFNQNELAKERKREQDLA